MKIANKSKLISVFILISSVYTSTAQIFIETPKDTIMNFYDREGYIQIDSSVQYLYQDSINIVKSKIKGIWQYQGELEGNKIVEDTLYWSHEGIFFVRNGHIYKSKNGIESKTDKIDVSSFDDHSIIKFHTITNEALTEYETKLCHSFYEVIYHANSIGLYNGTGFYPIKYLANNILIIEKEEEFDFKYINNDYSTIRVKKKFEYFIHKE
ncbi:MAG: hypothetical protein JNL70_17055 [Saprospiraceae bacterium]|nr:hypothetical protein [Saprospiraceae bacterium]